MVTKNQEGQLYSVGLRRDAASAARPEAMFDGGLWHPTLFELTPILMLYLALAFYRIGDQSLWTDEVISVWHTSEPIWTRIYSQSPLYFILLGLWTKLAGHSEFALRSFSTLLGIAAVFCTYGLGYRLFDRKTALFASILLATSPYFIWYAQEVRYIALMLVTALFMTYSFQRAIADAPGRWWLIYSASSLLAVFTFLTLMFVLLAHGIYLMLSAHHRPVLRKWLAYQSIPILLFAVWLGVRSGPKIIAALSKPPTIVTVGQPRSPQMLPLSDVLGAIPYTFFALSAGFSLGPSLNELHESRSFDSLMSHSLSLVPTAVLFGSVFFLGLKRIWSQRDTGAFLLLWLGVPMLGTFTVAVLTSYHVYNTRYVASVLPAYLLILAAGLTGIRRRHVRIPLFASLLVVSGLSLYNYYFDSRYARADARAAAQYLESAAQPGDIISVVGNPIALQYYYEGDLFTLSSNSTKNEPAIFEMLRQLPRPDSRLWLVEIRRWETDPEGTVRPFLDKLGRRRERKEFPGIDVYSYGTSN